MFAVTNHAVQANYLLTIMLLDLNGNAQAANWTCSVVISAQCNQRLLLAGQWLLFLQGSWPVDGKVFFLFVFFFLMQTADTRQWQFWFHAADLSCAFLCVCITLPPPCYSLSLSLSSSGLIRAGRKGEMVTVTTAENDRQRGRTLCVSADVYVCDWKMLFISIHCYMCIVHYMSLKVGISCSFSLRDSLESLLLLSSKCHLFGLKMHQNGWVHVCS